MSTIVAVTQMVLDAYRARGLRNESNVAKLAVEIEISAAPPEFDSYLEEVEAGVRRALGQPTALKSQHISDFFVDVSEALSSSTESFNSWSDARENSTVGYHS